MLRTALGPAIATFLEDPSIVEVMLNPDGRLWIDRLSGGLEDTSPPPPTNLFSMIYSQSGTSLGAPTAHSESQANNVSATSAPVFLIC
jgi:hypothetical protein